MRGEVTVYAGTIASDQALASLAIRASNAADWAVGHKPADIGAQAATLIVHAAAAHTHVIFEQTDADPGATWMSGPAGDRSTSPLSSSCERCAPDLGQRPPRLTLASIELAAVPPCRLRFAHLAVLDSADGPGSTGTELADFHRVGDSYVAHRAGSLEGGAEAHHCTTMHPFSYELFIDANDLGHYGVRDVQLEAPRSVCAP